MADALGVLSKAAFKKDRGLYGAGPVIAYPEVPGATDLAATHMIPFSSESMTMGVESLKNVSLVGAGAQLPADRIKETVSGGVEGQLAYQGWERLMAIAMGFEPPDDSPATLAAGAYAHLLECDYDLQDRAWIATEDRTVNGWTANDRKARRGQIGFAKQVTDWVFNSVMVNKVTISGTGNPSEIKIAFELIGYDLYRGAYNSTNWTLPAGSTALALFSQLVAKVGERAGGAGSLTTFGPSSFEIGINNNLKGDDQTTTSGMHIVQPVRGGMQEITFKLEFPRYNSDLTSLATWAELNTELAASLVFTGPQIGATGFYHTWELYMSSVRAKIPASNITGAAPLTQAIEFEVHRPSGSDIFDAGSYHGITTKKDSALVAVINNAFVTNYLLEV